MACNATAGSAGDPSRAEGRGDGALLALALDRELDLVTRGELADELTDVERALDRVVVDRDDHVTGLEPGLVGTAAGHDLAHERAGVARDVEALEDLGLHVVEV